MTIGERVKLKKKKKGMTQEELASLLGYKSKSSVTHIENGRDIPRAMVSQLAKILDVSPSYLMGWEDNNNADDSSEIFDKERPAMTSRQTRIVKLFDKLTTEQQDNIIGRAELLVEQNEEDFKKESCG